MYEVIREGIVCCLGGEGGVGRFRSGLSEEPAGGAGSLSLTD